MTDELNNRMVTDIESDPVRSLLRELRQVDAPGDFNFRVSARIAQGRPERSRSWMPMWVKAAAPLGLALAVGGYLVSGALYTGSVEMQPVAGFAPRTMVPVAQFTEEAPVMPVEQTVAEAAPVIPAAKTVARRTERVAPTVKRKQEVPTGGSYDEAVKETRKIVPNPVSPDDKAKPSDLGITSVTVGGARTVTAVKPGSRAANGGIKVGDVIESASGNTLTIRRDGKTVIIVLK